MICEVSTCNLALRTAYTTAYVTLNTMVCSGQANPSSSCSSWWVKERGRLKIHHCAMRLWSMGNDAHHGLWVASVPESHRSTSGNDSSTLDAVSGPAYLCDQADEWYFVCDSSCSRSTACESISGSSPSDTPVKRWRPWRMQGQGRIQWNSAPKKDLDTFLIRCVPVLHSCSLWGSSP